MTEGKTALNLFDDHPRWEDYKYEQMKFPNKDGALTSGSASRSRRFKPRKSILRKEGNNNVVYRGAARRRAQYVRDFYTTLVDTQWRWLMLLLFSSFLVSYLIFAVLYWLLSFMHGDFLHLGEPGWDPCILNVRSFWDCLMLSIETQSTIGYGILYPKGECGGTIPVIFLQVSLGFLMEFVLLSVIFVKVARPKHRRHTLMFSRNACLCQENGHLVLQLRVGDMRRTHLIDTSVHGMLVQKHVSQEKHVYPLFQHDMPFNVHAMSEGKVFLLWPLVFTHRIDHSSPLYDIKPEDLLNDKFEILLFLEGTIESTGESMQARTSFTAREILWGHRFARIEEYDEKDDIWCMDFVRFDNVVPSPTPKTSAREYWFLSNGTGGAKKDSLWRAISQGEVDRHSLSSHDPYDTASEEEKEEKRLSCSTRRLSS